MLTMATTDIQWGYSVMKTKRAIKVSHYYFILFIQNTETISFDLLDG